PEESKVLRAQIERDIYERYEILRRMAEEEPIRFSTPSSEKIPTGSGQEHETEQCEIKDVPEHARSDTGNACDDGRSGT
ncbi:MAG: hypothetical protein ACOC0T_01075, partial [Desulfovermiculus sp.]